MSIKPILQIVATLAISVSLSYAAAKPEDAAQKSAEQWLLLVDSGKYSESWTTAAAYFRAAIAQEQWVRALETTRKPLGELVSRKLKSAKYTHSLPGAPDGEYVVLQFDTSFTSKKTAVETITPTLEKDGPWRVSGYFIK